MSGSPTSRFGASFITIDGPDGSGKTTQAARLEANLVRRGIPVLLTREPGGTWLGERIRDVVLTRQGSGPVRDPLSDAFLFNAARRQLVAEVIRPALARGTTVVCARFADSTLAYQGFGAGAPIDVLRALASMATGGLVPDLTILLDLPVEAGLARKVGAEVTRFEADFDAAFHRRVRDGFRDLAEAEPARFVVIDATDPVDVVADAIANSVDARRTPSEPRRLALRITT